MTKKYRDKILEQANKRGLIFGDHHEAVNRLFGAIFGYLTATGYKDNWLKLCQQLTEGQVEDICLFYQCQKGVHPYGLKVTKCESGNVNLVINKEILNDIRKIASLDFFPFPERYQEDLIDSVNAPRFPNSPGVLFTENFRVHRYPLLKGTVYAMGAPNKKNIRKILELLDVAFILPLCGLLKPGQKVEGACEDYRDQLSPQTQVIHVEMPDWYFSLLSKNNDFYEALTKANHLCQNLLNALDQGKNIVLHCVAGVGRTGAFNLLLHSLCDKRIQEILVKITSPEDLMHHFIDIGEVLIDLLLHLRRTRHSIQIEEQFFEVFSHVVLLGLLEHYTLTETNVLRFAQVLIECNFGKRFLEQYFLTDVNGSNLTNSMKQESFFLYARL